MFEMGVVMGGCHLVVLIDREPSRKKVVKKARSFTCFADLGKSLVEMVLVDVVWGVW